jgi:nucleotide-binding universal stress UspA family protein
MFKRLLVPLDRSPLAEQALGQAAAIARSSHAAVDVVLVHEPLAFAGFADAPWNADQWEGEEKYIATIAEEVLSGAGVPISYAIQRGAPAETISHRAVEIDADLIVMTSHGRTGLSRAWTGSVADGVIRRSSVPVLLLRPVEGKTRYDAAHHLFEKILVPLDGSAWASDILAAAIALATSGDGRLLLLRVVQPVPQITVDASIPFVYPPAIIDDAATNDLVDEANEQLAELAQRLAADGIAIESQVVIAPHVAQAILDCVRDRDIDAIAMSTHGRGASRLLIGSVADKVLRGSDIPLLLRRPPEIIEHDEPAGSLAANAGSATSAS